ncbi:MAG TPA: ABC transporter permease [Thermomicrobiales bacterium]|nr:ABC transporter permease [Thermomicrobiales bacterium]
MSTIDDVLGFYRDRSDQVLELTWQHIELSLVALALATLIFVPLGIVFAHSERGGSGFVGAIASIRVIPSLALIFLFYPILGFGYEPALVALTVLAGPPLILNTFAGMRQVDAAVLEAAKGVGMDPAQVFLKVHFPLALPVIVAGMRSASVEIFASATLASFIGVRTLGQYVITGISLLDTTYLLAGGMLIVALVLSAELVLGSIERLVRPPVA